MDSDDTVALLTSWDLSLHDKAQSTRRFYRECVVGFARTLKEGGLLEVTRRDVQGYLAGCKAQGLAQATMRSRWIALRSFYGWALGEEEIAENPMVGVKVERANPAPIAMPDEHDLQLLLKACAGKGFAERRDLAMIRTAAATGIRVGELVALTLGDVDLAKRLVVVRHGKGDKARVTRVDDETGKAIDKYLRTRARHRLASLPALFISRFGPFTRKGAHAMLKRRCTEAGIPTTHWHALRHRFADQWLARGGQEGSLAGLGGWTDAATMRRYGAARATDRALAEYDELGGVL